MTLDNPPSYEALSYAWSVGQPDRLIRVNGRSLSVTPNLEATSEEFRQDLLESSYDDERVVHPLRNTHYAALRQL